jgi:hypothetical protein
LEDVVTEGKRMVGDSHVFDAVRRLTTPYEFGSFDYL